MIERSRREERCLRAVSGVLDKVRHSRNASETANALFARDELTILKKSKRGEKEVNVRDYMRGITLEPDTDCVRAYTILGAGNNNLSPEYLTKLILRELPQYAPDGTNYHHLMVYDAQLNEFR